MFHNLFNFVACIQGESRNVTTLNNFNVVLFSVRLLSLPNVADISLQRCPMLRKVFNNSTSCHKQTCPPNITVSLNEKAL